MLTRQPRWDPGGAALDSSGRARPAGPLKRANLDGTSIETIAGGAGDAAQWVDLDRADGRAYWNASNTNNIRRVFFDGSSVETLVTIGDGADSGDGSIAIDPVGARIYWPDPTAAAIRRRNADGTGAIETVVPGLTGPTAVAVLPESQVPMMSLPATALALWALGLSGALLLRRVGSRLPGAA